VAETITAIAALLWPLLLLVVLLMFRRPLARVVRSAEQREWTLEVGGQKLSMKQLSDQQNSMIADLQKQVGVLSQVIATLNAGAPAPAEVEGAPVGAADPGPVPGGGILSEVDHGWTQSYTSPPPPAVAHSVLWVDDHPENNALIVEQLQRNGVRVDLARTTREASALLGERRYGTIVSDMGRHEDGVEVPDAGLRLLKAVRQADPSVPFVIYCSHRALVTYRQHALDAGATEITSSSVVLSEQLRARALL
jgi:CheY-like chemotaxis protein